jgi:iron complex outermembrane receptor protein/hemoglobin/transferrin/lactoferrin receptor protein
MKTFFVFFQLIYLPFISLNAQSLKGKIIDIESGEAIPQASIHILNFNKTLISNDLGEFNFEQTLGGSFTLLISHIAYEDHYQTIDNQIVKELNIGLNPSIISLKKPLIITAQRSEKSEFELPQAIASLTQNQILAASPRTTPEALMGTSGIWVQKTNHGGGSAFVRGLTGNQVLLLVDGIRLNNSTFRYGPNQYLNTIDPLSLDRIEAVKGSGSVQYGSDAIGGAINLLSKNPTFAEQAKLSGNVFLKYLNLGMEQSGRTELNYANKKVAILGGFTYNNFGDLVAGKGLGRLSPSGYRQYAFDLKSNILLTDNQSLTIAHQYLRQNDVPIYHKVKLENFAYNDFEIQSRQLTYARWEYWGKSKILQKISITGFWNQTEEGRKFKKNNATTHTQENDRVHTGGFNFELLSQIAKNWQASSGIEFYHDKVLSNKLISNELDNTQTVSRGLYPDNSRAQNLAVFTLHSLRFSPWQLTWGLRFNAFRLNVRDETLGESILKPSALVGNLGIQYFLHPNHQLLATFNTAFRAPNIDDLGTLGVVDFRYEVPTFGLKPEKSSNYEIAYKMQTRRFSMRAAWFRNDLKDLILRVKSSYNGQTVIDGKEVYRKENVAQAYIQGFELDFESQIAKNWLLGANLSYLLGENLTDQEPLRRVPPVNGNLYVSFKQKNWWLKADFWAADKQNRLAKGDKADNRINPNGTPGWKVFNFSSGYHCNFMQIQAGIQNILNEAYRIHGSGVDGYGRSFWVSTKISF